MHRLSVIRFLLAILWMASTVQAQYKGNRIPGFVGVDAGTQAPSGLYAGNMVWVYPTSTLKNDSGDKVNSTGNLTSTADVILVNMVTNLKILGANYGVSAGIPFIKNRIQFNSLDVSSNMAFTDTFFTPASLGWHLKRADVTAAYNLYAPTGTFSPNARNNTGLGMWGNEFSLGGTVYLDSKRSWTAAANYAMEFHSKKEGLDLRVGDMATIEGGLGKKFFTKVQGPVPMITTIGVAGYSQFKVTGDSGSDIPLLLRGYKDRVFAVGPEFSTYIPKPRLMFLVRYLPEFGARNRSQGQTLVVNVIWTAKSLVKHSAP